MASSEMLICCNGVVRPAHIQRSYLAQTTRDAWVFECVEGKRRLGTHRPAFLWVLPRMTLSGWDVMPKIVNLMRTTPGKGESSWLLRQWAPSHSHLFSGER